MSKTSKFNTQLPNSLQVLETHTPYLVKISLEDFRPQTPIAESTNFLNYTMRVFVYAVCASVVCLR